LKPGEVVTLDLPDIHFRGPSTVVKIQPTLANADVEATVLRVVRFRHDDDLGTPLHGDWNPPSEFVERWKSRRRHVVLKLEYPDGGWCDIRLLRTVKWIAETDAQVGATIFLDLAEVGTRGWARVLEILPCGPIEIGPGDIVTGTFRHSHGHVGELVLESESKPIGVTPGHLFWSVDREAWVPVSSLRPGEKLQTLKGETRVVSYTMTDRVEPVYNIEVEGAHCYRVGESGVLVHNMSAPASQPSAPARAWPHCNKIPPAGHERDYQLHACGSVEYEISGNGRMKCADTVEGTVVVDCKALTNPRSSPQIGTAPGFITQAAVAQWSRDLREYETVISDPCSGLTKLVIRVEDQRQVAFWRMLLQPLRIATDVEVVP
jgi:hypothetical protein